MTCVRNESTRPNCNFNIKTQALEERLLQMQQVQAAVQAGAHRVARRALRVAVRIFFSKKKRRAPSADAAGSSGCA